MPRTVYYVASSVDGFIATPDHSLDWLLTRTSDPGGPMDLDAFVAGVGAIAMGASTYRWIRAHQDTWDYDVPTWVFTHRDLAAPPGGDVRFTADPVEDVHRELVTAAGDRDIWLMGGGELVGRFAEAGLLDEVVVCFAPVTLGAGAPLLPRRLELRCTEVAANGEFACARYDVVGPG